jgi:hypothetical protein
MNKFRKSLSLVAAGVISGAVIATGATLTIEAGASGTSTTYFGCLSSKGRSAAR